MRAACLLLAGIAILATACEREERRFVKPTTAPDPRAQAQAQPDLQPGQRGPGLRVTGSAGGYDESNAYEVSQGRTWYRWYNCAGCHAQGGGSMGPALMDDQWIYGGEPDAIFATIMGGRPNGMPAFRGRIPEAQAWQIVAYVRSMSGLLPQNVAPNRTEGMLGALPESRRDAARPDRKK
jgi:cytochrome c oxidase cbb3-type subunit 3